MSSASEPRPPVGPNVRPARAGDFDAIAAIVNREIREGLAHFGTEPTTADALRAEWRVQTRAGEAAPSGPRPPSRYPWYVSEDDTGVTGYARAGPWKTRGAYAWTTEIGVYLRPDRQGLGLGRALYGTLLPELEACGFRVVIAGVALPNPASVRLHETFGMKPIGVFPRVGFKHGEWIDVGYWVRHFGVPDP